MHVLLQLHDLLAGTADSPVLLVSLQEPGEPPASRIAFANVAANKADDRSSDSSDDGGAKSGNESGTEDDPDQARQRTSSWTVRPARCVSSP
jgi:hypothetical protein